MNQFKGIYWLRVILSQRWRALTKTERLVMLSLIARSRQFQCWPSFNEIAGDTGLERRAVMRAVTKLRDAGHIIVWAREGIRNKYSVAIWKDPDQCTQNTLVQEKFTSVQKRRGGVYAKDTSSLLTHCTTLQASAGQA